MSTGSAVLVRSVAKDATVFREIRFCDDSTVFGEVCPFLGERRVFQDLNLRIDLSASLVASEKTDLGDAGTDGDAGTSM